MAPSEALPLPPLVVTPHVHGGTLACDRGDQGDLCLQRPLLSHPPHTTSLTYLPYYAFPRQPGRA